MPTDEFCSDEKLSAVHELIDSIESFDVKQNSVRGWAACILIKTVDLTVLRPR